MGYVKNLLIIFLVTVLCCFYYKAMVKSWYIEDEIASIKVRIFIQKQRADLLENALKQICPGCKVRP